jgi:hypothetical protein
MAVDHSANVYTFEPMKLVAIRVESEVWAEFVKTPKQRHAVGGASGVLRHWMREYLRPRTSEVLTGDERRAAAPRSGRTTTRTAYQGADSIVAGSSRTPPRKVSSAPNASRNSDSSNC